MASLTFNDIRLGKEFPQRSQFGVLDQALTLSVGRGSFTIALGQLPSDTVIVHAALNSVMFGTGNLKLLIVPKDRSPAWLVQFRTAALQQECRLALIEQNAELTDCNPDNSSISDEALTAEVEQYISGPKFRGYLAQVEALFARRQSLQLPSLI